MLPSTPVSSKISLSKFSQPKLWGFLPHPRHPTPHPSCSSLTHFRVPLLSTQILPLPFTSEGIKLTNYDSSEGCEVGGLLSLTIDAQVLRESFKEMSYGEQ